MRWITVALLLATPAFAMHLDSPCPTLSKPTTAPPVPVGETSKKVQHANELIRQHLARNGKVPPGQLAKLLADRAPDLAWVCRSDADACLSLLLTPPEAAQVANDPCAERYAEMSGTVATIRSIAPDGTSGYTATVLHGDTDDVLVSVPTQQQGKLHPHQRHTLKGATIGRDTFVLGAGADAVQLATALPATGFEQITWPTTGPVSVLVVLVSHPDSVPTETPAQLATDTDWVRRFYASQSYGTATIVPTVWPTVVTTTVLANCDPFGEFRTIEPALRAAGIVPGNYHNIDIVSSFMGCAWGGVSPVGGNWSFVMTNGQTAITSPFQTRENRASTQAHELGHSLGVLHANRCDNAAPRYPIGGKAASPTCYEYGRNESDMGATQYSNPFGLLFRYYYGWLGVPDVQVNPAPGVYTLVPLGSSSGLRGLIFDDGHPPLWGLEYRAPIASDPFEAAVLPGGLHENCVHFTESAGFYAPEEDEHTLLPVPGNPCVGIGETVTSPVGWSARVDSVVPGVSAQVTVLAAGTTDFQSPTVAITSPTDGSQVAGTVALNATITDNNVWRVDWVARPAGAAWQTIASKTSPPYGATLDTTTIADGNLDIRLVVTDAVGHTASAMVTVLAHNGVTNTTTTSTSSTTLPNQFYAVLESEAPDPSLVGQPVFFTAHGERNGVRTPISGIYVSMNGQDSCAHAVDATGMVATCSGAYMSPCLPCRSSVWVQDATGTWSLAWLVAHNVVLPPTPTTSTLTPPSTTTSSTSSTTTTVKPTTTLVPTTTTTSTLKPTTSSTKAPTTSTTSTSRPTTTTLPCVSSGLRCFLGSTPCCRGLTCRRHGGQRRCQL